MWRVLSTIQAGLLSKEEGMSGELARKLVEARSAESFLRRQGHRLGWRSIAALKSEVDRLVVCDLNAAARLANRIEELATLKTDRVWKAFADASRARVLHYSGRHDAAARLYAIAAGTIDNAGLTVEAGAIKRHRVFALTQMGRYGVALRAAKAARTALAGSRPEQLAQLEANVGNIYDRLDKPRKALQCYDRARKILAIRRDRVSCALVDFNRSNVLVELDRHAEAAALLESAGRTFEKAGQSLRAAQARFHLAYIHYLRGDYTAALGGYYQARDRLVELGNDELGAWCNQEIAEVLLALNGFEDAAANAGLAESTFSRLKLPYESAQAMIVSAMAKAGLGEFDAAYDYLSRARKVFARNRSSLRAAVADAYLADVALRQGKAGDASRRARRAMRAFTKHGLMTRSAHSKLLAARAAYLLGKTSAARQLSLAALRDIKGLYAQSLEYQCHHLIGRMDRDAGKPRQALARFRTAVEKIESLRGGIAADEFKSSFLRDKIEVYEDAIAAYLGRKSFESLEEAFKLVEASKSRTLADLLVRYAQGRGKTRVSARHREQLSRLIADLNWYNARARLEDERGEQRRAGRAQGYQESMAKCEREIAGLFRRIEAEDGPDGPDGPERMHKGRSSDLRDALESGETAVEYFTVGDEVCAFIASRDGIRVTRDLASRQHLEDLLRGFRFQMEKFNYGSKYVDAHLDQLKSATDDYLTRFHQMLFAPIESAMAGDRVLIIPHGALHYVPFHALRGDTGYLVDRYGISYAPSAAVFAMCKLHNKRPRPGPANGKSPVVAIGLADSQTPHIEDEIDALKSIFTGTKVLSGERATLENLLKFGPGARLLHLASHGYFRRDNPMFSFLKLADYQLNFYSLLDLELSADLVTLSACHTGVNSIFPGDELHGLMRGFLYAGAPSLVVSLWAVSDRSTAEFMKHMYSRIAAGDSKRDSIRYAQLAIKDLYGHPYYWAPFVLMGNPT